MTTSVLALNAPLSPGRDLDGYLHAISAFPVLSVVLNLPDSYSCIGIPSTLR